MFKNYIVEDLVTLEVAEYLDDAHRKLTEKVISGVGLVVLVQEFSVHSEPKILPNDASALFTLRLKLLVFAPEVGELLSGTVVGSDSAGIEVSLGFFSDIKLISLFMPQNAAFDQEATTWYVVENDAKRYCKESTPVSFKVVEVTYNDTNDPSKDDQLPVMLVIGKLA
ncbi:DNA-DIRECTED RNA POLYMERASE II, III, putative [Babesia bigemina]|uniref:DNA-DIRECTED RNA POLYMERASE II, III, putative n=1 Tax=Babesia bigemina TaxID=5866 RepID=A0A061D8R4_BABBI|nr:DNA-DIRECTED RNA POLYMERASE II, III, putative [Babesia bigemina]CDR96928.1 DNA-DIRECTED RNA POLYMERASE II, III, putative [Babesia bigemina]|eukprot:XP_012769114.1 DNA-DIRECTED RNA POLYMERASE II, III, putative [Babesia bigemina]